MYKLLEVDSFWLWVLFLVDILLWSNIDQHFEDKAILWENHHHHHKLHLYIDEDHEYSNFPEHFFKTQNSINFFVELKWFTEQNLLISLVAWWHSLLSFDDFSILFLEWHKHEDRPTKVEMIKEFSSLIYLWWIWSINENEICTSFTSTSRLHFVWHTRQSNFDVFFFSYSIAVLPIWKEMLIVTLVMLIPPLLFDSLDEDKKKSCCVKLIVG